MPRRKMETPIHAAGKGHLDIVKCLIDLGAHVDAKDEVGQTPLMQAVDDGHLEVVKCLINNGAQIDAKDSDRVTSLHIAADKGFLEIA